MVLFNYLFVYSSGLMLMNCKIHWNHIIALCIILQHVYDAHVCPNMQCEQLPKQMASMAVFKLNCPIHMRFIFLWSDAGFALFSHSVCLSRRFLIIFSYFLSHSVSLPHFLFFTPFTAAISPSHILGMQIRICKCHGKHRRRCVTARTESARTESAWTRRHASQIGRQHGPKR